MSTSHEPITGSCLCQKVKYTISFPESTWPPRNHVCQCTMCRKHTGAIFAPFLVVSYGQITWHEGASGVHMSQSSDGKVSVAIPPECSYQEYESSPGRFRGYCTLCGSSLVWRSTVEAGHLDIVEILVGTLDEEFLIGKVVEPSNVQKDAQGREMEIPRREGGLAKYLAIPHFLCWWENAIPELSKVYYETKKYVKGSSGHPVTQEDVSRLQARALV